MGASQAASVSQSAFCEGECTREDCEDCGRGKGDCARGSFDALLSWVAVTGGLGERRPLAAFSQEVLVFAAENDDVAGAGEAKAGAIAVGADSNAPFKIDNWVSCTIEVSKAALTPVVIVRMHINQVV